MLSQEFGRGMPVFSGLGVLCIQKLCEGGLVLQAFDLPIEQLRGIEQRVPRKRFSAHGVDLESCCFAFMAAILAYAARPRETYSWPQVLQRHRTP